MKEPEDETGQQNSTPVPPFWIRPEDQRGRRVDSRILDASYRLWPWAYRHVERELRDGARAAELLEEVAMDVASRLRLEPTVARNLSGYLITAFHHRVRWERLRDRGLSYEGSSSGARLAECFTGNIEASARPLQLVDFVGEIICP